LTAAAALGITKSDVDSFIRRLDKVFAKRTIAASHAVSALASLTVDDSQSCSVNSDEHEQLDSVSTPNDSTAVTEPTV